MSILHLLEDFSGYSDGKPITLTDVLLEEQRLESFEAGYQAGWEDAVKAQADECRQISADLAQNLQDLSFTYQEARAAVIESLAPLLTQMVETVLPKLAHQHLPERVAEVIKSLSEEQGRQTAVIHACIKDIPALEAVLAHEPEMNVTLTEDEAMAEGQLRIQLGQTEREFDLRAVLDGLERAVSNFFHDEIKESA
jgi:flagellar assembly protein FliH